VLHGTASEPSLLYPVVPGRGKKHTFGVCSFRCPHVSTAIDKTCDTDIITITAWRFGQKRPHPLERRVAVLQKWVPSQFLGSRPAAWATCSLE
jgi:hypothetical protein